jgi:uncharacterized protein
LPSDFLREDGAMKKQSEFDIVYTGLGLGNHQFSYQLDREFFQIFDHLEYTDGFFDVNINLEKTETMLTLFIELDGTIQTQCDRCGDDLPLQTKYADTLYVKFGEGDSTDDAVWILPFTEHKINIAELLAEFTQLSVPLKKTHKKGKCNPEMIRQLEDLETRKQDAIDPRWEALQNLKLNK